MNLNEMAARVHGANAKWWTDINTGEPIKRNRGELLMLVVTELAEAVEGLRKDLPDDKLPHRKMEEVELADAIIRLLDFAGGFKMRLPNYEPMEGAFNKVENKAEMLLHITSMTCLIYSSQIPDQRAFTLFVVIAYIMEYGRIHKLDIEGAIEEKLAYNAKREDHTHEHRKTKHGKKF